jgi:hypothetical protein
MMDERRNVMRTVNLDKEELLKIVRANKEKHIVEYAEAVEDYKVAAVKIAKMNLKLANTGDMVSIAKIQSMPASPTSYEDSYTRSIRMLELSVDKVIELEETIFNQLVLDEWNWKRTFAASSAMYKTFVG